MAPGNNPTQQFRGKSASKDFLPIISPTWDDVEGMTCSVKIGRTPATVEGVGVAFVMSGFCVRFPWFVAIVSTCYGFVVGIQKYPPKIGLMDK